MIFNAAKAEIIHMSQRRDVSMLGQLIISLILGAVAGWIAG